MLSYCINIAFYLLLKAEGKPVKDHPVVLRLVEIRTYIEKLRPIDKKLKYQIDKLLKMAKEGVTGEEEDADGAGEDPLQFRPNPDALVSKVDEDAEEGADGGVYRPPKMMPTAMEGPRRRQSSKQKRAEKEARRRAQRSSLIKVRIVDRLRAVLFRSPARFVSLRSPFASSISVSREMRGDRSRDHMAYTNRTRPWAGYRSNAMSGVFPIKRWTFIDDSTLGSSRNTPVLSTDQSPADADRELILFETTQELAQELGEAPEELGGDEGDMQSAFTKREFARMEARAKIEEDPFTRVPSQG